MDYVNINIQIQTNAVANSCFPGRDCMNNGQCVRDSGGDFCQCNTEWSGDLCNQCQAPNKVFFDTFCVAGIEYIS